VYISRRYFHHSQYNLHTQLHFNSLLPAESSLAGSHMIFTQLIPSSASGISALWVDVIPIMQPQHQSTGWTYVLTQSETVFIIWSCFQVNYKVKRELLHLVLTHIYSRMETVLHPTHHVDAIKIDWVKVLQPTWHKIGHCRDVLPSQSLGIVLKN